MKYKRPLHIVTDIVSLSAIFIFMSFYFDIRHLFTQTTVTGGDTASWFGIADHLVNVLLPNFRLTGWDMGNFCGYPNFSFYFLPPFLIAAIPTHVLGLPLTITLKIAIMSGIYLLPFMTYFGLRAMKYPFPVPIIGASASLLFLFNETYTMFGGNTLSTFAGEFCYMFAFSLFVYFIGSLYEGIRTDSKAVKNGVLLGLIGLSHLFVFIPSLLLLIYWFFEKGNIRYILKTSIIAFGLMAFWILPLVIYRHPYTTPVYMIWQPFVNWRYVFMGIGIILLIIVPRVSLIARGETGSSRSVFSGWHMPMLIVSTMSVFVGTYLIGQYAVYGKGLCSTGLEIPTTSTSPIGISVALLLRPYVLPVSLCMSIIVFALGLRAFQTKSRYVTFCNTVFSVSILAVSSLAWIGIYSLFTGSISHINLRAFLENDLFVIFLHSLMIVIFAWIIFLKRRSRSFIQKIPSGTSHRFRMFLALGFGCVVLYFSSHFIEVPDVRFLPPILFVLVLIFFADTLEPVLSCLTERGRTFTAIVVSYLCMMIVVFTATDSHLWFRFNNEGYERKTGYKDFINANEFLKNRYGNFALDPMNAPRVGYEKCDLYNPYGGDRVFESLPVFSERQTLEGIHYASSIGSKCITFLQTEYSRDIKTPRAYILSRMNPNALPSHFDLYNISELILMTDEAKKAIASSPAFEKEAAFGAISIYRYKDCNGRYVDVPGIWPVLYKGKEWVEDFYQWFKNPKYTDVLLVPSSFVKNSEDRALFTNEISSVKDLIHFKREILHGTDVKIHTNLDHLRIRFTTNKVGLPHVVKVSYFPNWQVKGAHGIYPVSPHFMLVIPRESKITISYHWSLYEKLGFGMTVATLMTILVLWVYKITPFNISGGHIGRSFIRIDHVGRNLNKAIFQPMEKLLTKMRVYLMILILCAAVGLITGGSILRNKPTRTYVEGFAEFKTGLRLMELQQPQKAKEHFKKAIDVMAPVINRKQFDHQDLIRARIYTAMSFEKLDQWTKAEDLYRSIIAEFPYSRFMGEAYVKIGRIRIRGRDQVLERGIENLRYGDEEQGLLSIEKAIQQTFDYLHYLRKARKSDPYSVWSKYALEDMERERRYFLKKRDELFDVCDDADVRNNIILIIKGTEEAE